MPGKKQWVGKPAWGVVGVHGRCVPTDIRAEMLPGHGSQISGEGRPCVGTWGRREGLGATSRHQEKPRAPGRKEGALKLQPADADSCHDSKDVFILGSNP